jgi:hypothetical protein
MTLGGLNKVIPDHSESNLGVLLIVINDLLGPGIIGNYPNPVSNASYMKAFVDYIAACLHTNSIRLLL